MNNQRGENASSLCIGLRKIQNSSAKGRIYDQKSCSPNGYSLAEMTRSIQSLDNCARGRDSVSITICDRLADYIVSTAIVVNDCAFMMTIRHAVLL